MVAFYKKLEKTVTQDSLLKVTNILILLLLLMENDIVFQHFIIL